MSRKQFTVSISGISSLLMHRFPLEPIEAIEKKTPEEQAEIAAYRDSDGQLYIPGMALQRAMVSGGTYVKGKGRASLQKPVAACVFVTPEYLVTSPQEYVIDSRAVVVPATKGRIVRHRPRLDEWSVQFQLEYDDAQITAIQLREILDKTGSNVGLLDFRPERKGPHGRFQVNSWKSVGKK